MDYGQIYEVHTISFLTFFVWALLLTVHSWNSSPLRSNLLRLKCNCCTIPITSGRPHGSPLVWACQWPFSQPLSSAQRLSLCDNWGDERGCEKGHWHAHTRRLPWGLPDVVVTVQQVYCNRRRLLRRRLEFHVCTINKSTHTKKGLETYRMHLVKVVEKSYNYLKRKNFFFLFFFKENYDNS